MANARKWISTVAAVTSIDGLFGADTQLSTGELPYYTTGSGTSFSAPQVAGVVALMLELNPQLTPAQVRDILAAHRHATADVLRTRSWRANA